MNILSRKYTKKEQDLLLSSMGVLIDSREKSNKWIIDAYDKQGITYKVKKLDFADYAPYIPPNDELGIEEEISFAEHISIERKNSIDEIAGNITKDRERFKREFERHEGQMILMIEGGNYEDICKANYRSQIKPLSFIGTLHSWQHRYDVPFVFVDKNYSAQYIYYTFYYWLKIYLEGLN